MRGLLFPLFTRPRFTVVQVASQDLACDFEGATAQRERGAILSSGTDVFVKWKAKDCQVGFY